MLFATRSYENISQFRPEYSRLFGLPRTSTPSRRGRWLSAAVVEIEYLMRQIRKWATLQTPGVVMRNGIQSAPSPERPAHPISRYVLAVDGAVAIKHPLNTPPGWPNLSGAAAPVRRLLSSGLTRCSRLSRDHCIQPCIASSSGSGFRSRKVPRKTIAERNSMR